MAKLKPIGRLGVGWLLMLGGMLALLDSLIPFSAARSSGSLAAEASAGFSVLVVGWLLRRSALPRNDEP
jgi:hypothetical protein